MAVLEAPAQPASGKTAATKAAVQANPFTKASRRMIEPIADISTSLIASARNLQQQDVPATGFLRHVLIDVEATGTTGATYTADAPWSVFDQVSLTDVNGQPMTLLSGWDLFLANLFGGYAFFGDPRDNPNYALTTTGFRFQLRAPVEIVQRNALGALLNTNASMTYKLKMQLAPAAEVYATNSTDNAVRIRTYVESWMSPQAADIRGVPNTVNPPALGTTQNWSEYVAPVTVGNNTIRLPRVGNTIRNLVFIYRDASGVRTNTGLPEEITKLIDGNQWSRNSFAYERERIGELYGLGAAEIPAGVWVVCLTDDFDATPGEEIGDYWLVTSGATRLEVQGQFTAIGSLTVMTNDILAFADKGGPGQTLG